MFLPKDSPQRLFVYGTLAPGRANHDRLEHIRGIWQRATLRGTLYEEGWGAAMGYPCVVPASATGDDAEGDEVEGFVFSSTELQRHWPALDDFEGEGYRRVLVKVRCDEGEVEAFVYALAQCPGVAASAVPPDLARE